MARLVKGFAVVFCLALFTSPSATQAYSGYDTTWESVYPSSSSENNSTPCKLCHTTNAGGASWNAYGWAIKQAAGALNTRILNVQNQDSDGDPAGSTNLAEINANTQPGWTDGAHNKVYGSGGLTSSTALPPGGILGSLDIPVTFTVGGVISGLTGGVTLQNNGGNNLTRSSNGAFTFSNPLPNGSSYAVTVLTQPAGQICTVTSGSGTISNANVTNVGVVCVDNPTSPWPVSPVSVNEPEGTVVQISYTVQQTDWVVPDSYWLGLCADFGTVNAKWVFVFHFEPLGADSDFHLLAGENVIGNSQWFYCSDQTTPPTITNTSYFKISLLNDNLVEREEYAFIDLYFEDSNFNKIYNGTIYITIQDTTAPNTNVCSTFSIECNGIKQNGSITLADCDDSPRGNAYLAEIRTFEGVQGEPVVIHADWDMDGYLFLEAPDGSYLYNDDLNADIYQSRIETTLSQTGTYKIWATTYWWATSGNYEIYASCPTRPVVDLVFRTGFESLVTNKPPIANAGTDQVVYGGGSFPATLIGERSVDVDGKIVSVTWTQLSGPTASLGAKTGLNQEYFPSAVSAEDELVFELSVEDNFGVTDKDTVSIKVLPSEIDILLSSNYSGAGTINLLLFDPDGNLLASDSGTAPSIRNYRPGAGVVYAVATAASQPASGDLTLEVFGPPGVRFDSTINPTQLSLANMPFLTLDDFADDPARYLVFGHASAPEVPLNETSFPEHPQIVEIALSQPDPGLRDLDRFLSFLNQTSSRFQEDDATAEAYYRAVDPYDERTNLDDWLQVTGFKDYGADAHALYKNDADLGFGRDMYMRKNPDGSIASYVRNYPSLEHAVAHEKLIATVAMEFSPSEGHPEPYTKFFVFGPDGQRLLSADLDGRGEKPVPGVCNVCHGGAPKATYEDNQGDTDAQFLPWDIDTFIFLDEPGLTRADQEYQLYHLNQLAMATYPTSPDLSDNRWTGAAAIELVNGWYNGGEVFDGSFVPPGWSGKEKLYHEVVGPNCRACHITRGTALQNSIDFSTYDKFMAYAPLIRELVYDQGLMPLAVRTFGHFWAGEAESPAAKLAAALPEEFDLLFTDGDTVKPGRPIARTGMAYGQPPEFRALQDDAEGTLLDGRDSLFASDQDWRVVSASFTPEEVLALGDYAVTKSAAGDEGTEFRLARQIAPPAAVKRTLFTRDLIDIGYFNDIDNLLKANCASGCHSASGISDIPVYFDLAGDAQYRAVLDLINFEQPTQSLLLTKPAGFRHYGGTLPGFEYLDANGEILPLSSAGELARLIAAWIQNGAPE